MNRTISKFIIRGALLALATFLLVFGLPCLITEHFAAAHLYPLDAVPPAPVAVVFGAGLSRDGSPSPILRDRVEMAAKLYFAGKVEKLLMSGDNRFEDYNEPGAMKNYAEQMGVPEEDIVLDYAGRRTYDTCYRARQIFGVEDAILVTQRYHLTRALYTCKQLGVQVSGVPADQRTFSFRKKAFWQAREVAATTVALWEVWVSRPLPVLGDPEPIFTSGDPLVLPVDLSLP